MYAPPTNIGNLYSDADLDRLFHACGRHSWAVHLIGPDEIRTQPDPTHDDDNSEDLEFTQRTALKFAADYNAHAPTSRPDGHGTDDTVSLAVVLHNGEPWIVGEDDGPA